MKLQPVLRGNPDGPPVVFLHGGSFTGRMWWQIADLLPDFYSVIPDLPGHGNNRAQPLISLSQAADDVADLIKELFGDQPVNLVGLSLGGYVGLHLLLQHPQLIKRAMISGVHAGNMPHPKLMILATTLSSPLMRFRWFRKQMVKMMGLDDYSLASDEESRANASPKTMRKVGRLAIEFDVREKMELIATPTLVLAGEKEHDAIRGDLSLFQNKLKQCRAMTVRDVGHGWSSEDPVLFAETARAWFNKQALPQKLQPL
ncbi:alpha/beta fold hydrolase [Parasphingorhabdus sp.]|uniref:alpha/beta fold hydrolase n=1 Tax=Parasphingorhabdus sp. TaxID=2709688 RepID=UPI003BB0E397